MPTAGWLGIKGAWAAGSSQGLSNAPIAGDGWVHKAVNVGTTMHIIEELQVFPAGQPVRHLLLDADRVSRLGSPAVGLGHPALLPQLGGEI